MVAVRLPTPEDVRRLRKMAGLTQKELAIKAHVSQSLIARIEAGHVDPRLSTLQKILSAITSTEEKNLAQHIMHTPVISVDVTDRVRKAVDLMKKYDVSQLPVLRGKRVVGSIQETTLIKRLLLSREPEKVYNGFVQDIMEAPFVAVEPSAGLNEILTLLGQGHPAVLVLDEGNIAGIITKIDAVATLVKSGKK
jgi:predicted transcriptional regulator